MATVSKKTTAKSSPFAKKAAAAVDKKAAKPAAKPAASAKAPALPKTRDQAKAFITFYETEKKALAAAAGMEGFSEKTQKLIESAGMGLAADTLPKAGAKKAGVSGRGKPASEGPFKVKADAAKLRGNTAAYVAIAASLKSPFTRTQFLAALPKGAGVPQKWANEQGAINIFNYLRGRGFIAAA